MPSGESPLKLAYVILSMRSLKDSILKFHMQLLLAGKRAALKLSNVREVIEACPNFARVKISFYIIESPQIIELDAGPTTVPWRPSPPSLMSSSLK